MSANASTGRDVVELWGREFNIVRSGLSEAQVVSFVNELVKQHDLLLQRQDHLATLTRLAERTVSEADKLSDEIKAEARKVAEDDAARLVAEAEASAKDMSASIVKEAQARAEQDAQEKERQKLSEAENEVRRMIADAESKGRRIVEQKEAEALASANSQANAIMAKALEEASTLLEREKQRIQPELNDFVLRFRGQLLTELDQLKSQVGALEPRFEIKLSREPQDAVAKSKDKPKRQDEFLDLMGGGDSGESGDPEWEIEIVPPIDIMKIMSIVGHLDGLPGVSRTEIIPRNDGTSIMVYGQDEIEITDSLRTLPEVGQVEEIGGLADEDKPRKLMIALSVKGSPAEGMTSADDLLHEGAT